MSEATDMIKALKIEVDAIDDDLPELTRNLTSARAALDEAERKYKAAHAALYDAMLSKRECISLLADWAKEIAA